MKLEEAQADITPRLVVIARKETVIYVSRRPLGKFSQNECFRKCLRVQAPAGQSSPAGDFSPGVFRAGGGSPRQEPWMGRWAPGGPRRDSPWGAGENPHRGCGKTVLMERQRPDRPGAGGLALREQGNEIRCRKGRRKVSRERNYHHNGGKNVSRGEGGGNPILLAFSVCLCDMVRGKKGP